MAQLNHSTKGRIGAAAPGKTLKRLLSYLTGGYRAALVLVCICILVSALAGVAGSLFLEILIDDYITPMLQTQNPVFTGLLHAIAIMAGVYLAGIAATLLYNWLMVVISQGIQKKIRDELFAHLQKLPVRYFDTHSHGDIMSHFTNDIDTLRQMLSQSIPQLFSSAVTILAVTAAMLYVSIPLTLIVAVLAVVMFLASKSIAGKSASHFIKQQDTIGTVNGYIEEMMNGQKVVKVFCHEEAVKSEFDVLNGNLCDAATDANRYANILMPVLGNLGHLQYVILAAAGGAMAISGIGGITIGMIASFLQLSRSFTQPISQISQQLNSVIMALAGASRIFSLMDEAEETDNGYVTLVHAEEQADGTLAEAAGRTGTWAWKHPHEDGTVTYTKLTGDVRLSEVDFAYDGEKLVLQDVSIYANPGETVAFVGSTGAGKTTITNLINRFYDIADGKVRYDGININKIRKPDLRRSLGMVLQDTNLFTGSIRDNIRYGRLDATDEEVEAAARLAGAHDFITRLPEGYDTCIPGNGGPLSQGQMQLLSIARAAVLDPPVMILDEATSSIDTRTERIVQEGMDSLMKGRTVFVIAHRLSTIRDADVIMVLEHGRIIERGPHDKLIAQRGKYYQLYTGAFELE